LGGLGKLSFDKLRTNGKLMTPFVLLSKDLFSTSFGQAARLTMDGNLGYIFFSVNKKYHLCKKYDVIVCIWCWPPYNFGTQARAELAE
jgi:hypothetical protein